MICTGGGIRTPINGFGDHYTSPCTTPVYYKPVEKSTGFYLFYRLKN
ncbi:hypothetical protein FLAVO9AF_100065 [Flavobacterium sp. 9AF]|nr:hypothetical protein FLAVO9AF_100065 [Flavobacterium sp. 9AF]